MTKYTNNFKSTLKLLELQAQIFEQIIQDDDRTRKGLVEFHYAIDFRELYKYVVPDIKNIRDQEDPTIDSDQEDPTIDRVIIHHLLSDMDKIRFVLLPSHFQEMLDYVRWYKTEIILRQGSRQGYVVSKPDREKLNKLVEKYRDTTKIELKDENELIRIAGPIVTNEMVNLQMGGISGIDLLQKLVQNKKLMSEYDLPDLDKKSFDDFLKTQDVDGIYKEIYDFIVYHRDNSLKKLSNIRDSEACSRVVLINRFYRAKKIPHRLQLIASTEAILEGCDMYRKKYTNHAHRDLAFARSPAYMYYHHAYHERDFIYMKDLIRDFLNIVQKYRESSSVSTPSERDTVNRQLLGVGDIGALISQLENINLLVEKGSIYISGTIKSFSFTPSEWNEVRRLLLITLSGELEGNIQLDLIKQRLEKTVSKYESVINELLVNIGFRTLDRSDIRLESLFIDTPLHIFEKDLETWAKELREYFAQHTENLSDYINNQLQESEGESSTSIEALFKLALISTEIPGLSLSLYLFEKLFNKLLRLKDQKPTDISELCLLQATILRRKASRFRLAYDKCINAFNYRGFDPGNPQADWRLHNELSIIILNELEYQAYDADIEIRDKNYINYIKNLKFKGHKFDDITKFQNLALQSFINSYYNQTNLSTSLYSSYFYLINNILYVKAYYYQEVNDKTEEYWKILNSQSKEIWWKYQIYDTAAIYCTLKVKNLQIDSQEYKNTKEEATKYFLKALEYSKQDKNYHMIIHDHIKDLGFYDLPVVCHTPQAPGLSNGNNLLITTISLDNSSEI